MKWHTMSQSPLKMAQIFSRSIFDWRFVLLISFVMILLTPITLILKSFIGGRNFLEDIASNALPASLLGILYSFFLFVASRLNLIRPPTQDRSLGDSYIIFRLNEMDDRLEALAKRYSSSDSEFTKGMAPQLEELSRAYFETAAMHEIEKKIQDKYGDAIENNTKVQNIRHLFEKTVDKMNEQLLTQRTNSNINLLIGLIFAAGGIIVLGYVFYITYISTDGNTTVYTDPTVFFLTLIPRVTFAILIETVAFFFLSLYREDRNMLRFLRNEITNYEAKFLALETAARFNDAESLTKCIAMFNSTERNFLLKKGDKLITEALRENDERLFDKLIDKLSNNFDLSKLRK